MNTTSFEYQDQHGKSFTCEISSPEMCEARVSLWDSEDTYIIFCTGAADGETTVGMMSLITGSNEVPFEKWMFKTRYNRREMVSVYEQRYRRGLLEVCQEIVRGIGEGMGLKDRARLADILFQYLQVR